MAPKKKTKLLTAVQLEALPISIGEARKLLGKDSLGTSDNEVAQQVLHLNEMAVIVYKNIDLHKMHL